MPVTQLCQFKIKGVDLKHTSEHVENNNKQGKPGKDDLGKY